MSTPSAAAIRSRKSVTRAGRDQVGVEVRQRADRLEHVDLDALGRKIAALRARTACSTTRPAGSRRRRRILMPVVQPGAGPAFFPFSIGRYPASMDDRVAIGTLDELRGPRLPHREGGIAADLRVLERRRRLRARRPLPAHGVPAAPGHGRERAGHLPLAQRPVRPAVRRHVRPLGRRRAGLPGRDRRRHGHRRRRARARPHRVPAPTASRRGSSRASRSSSPRPCSGCSTAGVAPRRSCAPGSTFGTRYRQAGWGAGLTVLTAMANVLPHLDEADHALALVHGLAFVSRDTRGRPPRFPLLPLRGAGPREPADVVVPPVHRDPIVPTPPSARWRPPSPPSTRPRSPTRCSRRSPTTSSSTAATPSTSPTRRSRCSTTSGRMPRPTCCRRSSRRPRPRVAARSRARGATPST